MKKNAVKNNAVCNYDFTLWNKKEEFKVDEVKAHLKEIAKKWCFQAEDAGSGKHYQGRFSLKVKKRIGEFDFFSAHLSQTSKLNIDNDFYVSKDETRVGGPWRDTDMYIPRQVRDIVDLYPWQKKIKNNIGVWDTRTINIIYDCVGNIGKSTLVAALCCELTNKVRVLPALPNFKDILGAVMCMPTALMYICDMPRGLDKAKMSEFFAAIECIKNGHVYDTRYTFKEKWFDCPNIWVFTNVMPEREWLSKDRWRWWEVAHGDLKALRCNSSL